MFTSLGKAGTIAILCVAAVTLTAGAIGLQQLLSSQDEEQTPNPPASTNNLVAQNDGPDGVAQNGEASVATTRPGLKGQGHTSPPVLLQVTMQRLHEEAVQRFLSAPENGMRRMVIFPKKIESEWKTPLWSPSEVTRETAADSSGDLTRIHEKSLENFLNPNLAAAKKVVRAGDPEVIIHLKDRLDRKKHKDWEIKALDLVGLVKYDHPVVYVSEKLPDMKNLKDVPTRLLDFFELSAVEELRKGDDLFISSKEGTVRVLGAIRAREECLKCHGGKQGELLGAFSYTLRPAQYVDPHRNASRTAADVREIVEGQQQVEPPKK